MRFLLIGGAILATLAESASAQQFTVQQPSLSSFSVGTAVSMPDRGRAVIGGVSRAGSSRSTYGRLRSGTNTGVFAQHSSASAHVTIHDFAEMDHRTLSATPPRPRDDAVNLPINAAHAYNVLQSRAITRRP